MTLSTFFKKWRPKLADDVFEGMLADLAEMTKPPQPPHNVMMVECTVSHRDLRPLVSVTFGAYQIQLDPQEARKLGTDFLDVAHAAELDSYLYQYFCGEQDIPKEQVGMMVAHFRKWREDHAKVNAEPPTGAKQ